MPHLHVTPVFFWFWLPFAGIAAFALLAGGPPERFGAASLAIASALSRLVRPPEGVFAAVPKSILIVDVALFVALMILSIKARRRWPILLSTFQGLVLLGHLGKAVDAHLWALGYWLLVTPPQLLGLLILLVGTARHRGRMRRLGIDPPWKR